MHCSLHKSYRFEWNSLVCHEFKITNTGMFFVSRIAKITFQISRLLERNEFTERVSLSWCIYHSDEVYCRRFETCLTVMKTFKSKNNLTRLCTIAVPVLGNFSLLFKCVSFQLCSVFAKNRFRLPIFYFSFHCGTIESAIDLIKNASVVNTLSSLIYLLYWLEMIDPARAMSS